MLFLLLRIVNINVPLINMHNVRQTQTSIITRDLLFDNMNIFMIRVDWRGNSPGYFIQEFSLDSTLVVILWTIIGVSDIWGRTILTLKMCLDFRGSLQAQVLKGFHYRKGI